VLRYSRRHSDFPLYSNSPNQKAAIYESKLEAFRVTPEVSYSQKKVFSLPSDYTVAPYTNINRFLMQEVLRAFHPDFD